MPRRKEEENARAWCFTENNPTTTLDDLKRQVQTEFGDQVRYFICQVEAAPTTGTPHFQGYIYFKDAKSFSTVTKWRPRARFEKAKRSAAENEEYCSKPKGQLQPPVTIGQCPGQGKRSDLHAVAESVSEGKSLKDIADEHPTQFIKYFRGINELITIKRDIQPRSEQTECWIFYGASGTGKTRLAHELAKRAGAFYSLSYGNHGTWWDGYNYEPTVIADEFKGSIKFGDFKRMVDRVPWTIERKGVAGTEFTSRTVIITSNYEPEEWWELKGEHDKQALRRRIHLLVKFDWVPGLGVVRLVLADNRAVKDALPEYDDIVNPDEQ